MPPTSEATTELPRRIVFVCSGNICRSPMAEALWQRAIEFRGGSGAWLSMGTLNIEGRPAHPHAVQALGAWQIDLAGHRSQGISLGLLRRTDAIVVMAREHGFELARLAPELRPRIQLVSSWDPSSTEGPDVSDPLHLGPAAFEACRDRLWRCIARRTGLNVWPDGRSLASATTPPSPRTEG